MPAEPVAIPYTDMRPFVFNPMPVSLATNGVAVPSDMSFEWVNTGLWRGTMEDAAWLERLYTSDVLAAGFEALAAGQAVAQPGGVLHDRPSGPATHGDRDDPAGGCQLGEPLRGLLRGLAALADLRRRHRAEPADEVRHGLGVAVRMARLYLLTGGKA